MSLKDQIALGKNTILQKKCDQTCSKFKRDFRQSRRRINALEEDCVKSLYHLLLDAKDRQNRTFPMLSENEKIREKGSRKVKSAVYGSRSTAASNNDNTEENVVKVRRPATSMSVRNYQVSYSFVKNGMDISKIQRVTLEPFDKSNNNDAMNTGINHSIIKQRPKTPGIEINVVDATVENDVEPSLETVSNNNVPRPVSVGACLKRSPSLNRPQITNTLINRDNLSPASKNTDSMALAKQAAILSGSTSNLNEISSRAHLQVRPATVLGNVTDPTTLLSEDGQLSTVFRVSATSDDESNNELSDNEANTSSYGTKLVITETNLRDPEEEITLNEQRSPSTNMSSNTGRQRSCNRSSSSVSRISFRSRPNQKSARSVDRQSDTDTTLQQSAEKTQRFLKEYAKKSKLFSYVVNANASAAAGPKEKKIHRSPNVTYQELVSIKASIQKQMMQTRDILQKSARLSNYVTKLTGLGAKRAQREEQT